MTTGTRAFRLIICMLIIGPIVLFACRQGGSDRPAARYGAGMVYDPGGDRVLLFGGRSQGLTGLVYHDDLWSFDLSTEQWERLRTSGRPPGRLSPGMVHDTDRHRIILYGGVDDESRLADTWAYDTLESRWHELTPAMSPPPRSDMGMTYDAAEGLVVLFGGYCQESSRALCNDTWVYDPAANSWTEMDPPAAPPITYGPTMDYDPASGRSLLWGGHTSAVQDGVRSSTGYSNVLWSYDLRQDSWQAWEAGSGGPLARYWHASALDPSAGALVLFGGDGGRGFLADTWLLDLTLGTWSKVSSESAPSPRINAAMVYASSLDGVVLFGGSAEGHKNLGDTWVLEQMSEGGAWKPAR